MRRSRIRSQIQSIITGDIEVPHVLKHLGFGIPAHSNITQDEYVKLLSANKAMEDENVVILNKPAFSRFSRHREDLRLANSSFVNKLAESLNLPQLYLVKSAPHYMSGLVLLSKCRDLKQDLMKRLHKERTGSKRLCFETELILVGHRSGNLSPEREELTKFWTRKLKINGVNQLVQAFNVTTSQIRKNVVQQSNGQFATVKLKENRVHAILKSDDLFDGVASMFALKQGWSILGDHLYSQRLNYVGESVKLIDANKCSPDQVQNLSEDVRKDLRIQRDSLHQLIMFAHFKRIHIPKTQNGDEISIECDTPSYFDAAVNLIFK